AIEALNTRNKTETELETVGVSIGNIDQQLEGIYSRQQDLLARNETLSGMLQAARKVEAEKRAAHDGTVESRKKSQEERQGLSEKLESVNRKWQELREEKSSK